MPPKTTLWPLESHTLGKHLVLQRYLQAWLPVMSTWNGRILFIDGFAGPGRYSSGEDGSPIIALKALAMHASRERITAEVSFVFIEKEEDRARFLDGLVTQLSPELPSSCRVKVINGVFDDTMTSVLDQLDQQAAALAPAFVMVDPFGVAGPPMSVLARILRNDRSELYISFMYEAINRFGETPEFQAHLDDLFGSPDWRECFQIHDPDLGRARLYDLYDRQLRNAGAKYVIHFELFEGHRLVYSIFFATQHAAGCSKMKEAVWHIAPFGDYSFRGGTKGQLTLGLRAVDTSLLRQQLLDEFAGRGWVTIEEVEVFVRSDRTLFHCGHLKKRTLVPMEDSALIDVDVSSRSKQRTYPAGTRLRFRSPPGNARHHYPVNGSQ